MFLEFSKYQGAGNDFIIFDGRDIPLLSSKTELAGFFRKICRKNFGVGADGVIVLEEKQGKGLVMRYYNSDGLEGSMCGNGGRCFVAFAAELGLVGSQISFWAVDGKHKAIIDDLDKGLFNISLEMNDVGRLAEVSQGVLLNTGSPHLVVFCDNVSKKDVFNEGRELRYNPSFGNTGVNVNFVEIFKENHLKIRTYERGVENETLACGTGAVAAAIATNFKNQPESHNCFEVEALGGKLKVSFEAKNNSGYKNVWLSGPAQKVFEGRVEYKS